MCEIRPVFTSLKCGWRTGVACGQGDTGKRVSVSRDRYF